MVAMVFIHTQIIAKHLHDDFPVPFNSVKLDSDTSWKGANLTLSLSQIG